MPAFIPQLLIARAQRMRFDVILFVLTSCTGLLCDVITTDEPSTVSDFVDLLKRDLRRNNDDYVESSTVPVKVSNPYLLDITKDASNNDTQSTQTLAEQDKFYYRREPSNKNKLLSDTKSNGTIKRRVFDSLEDKIAEIKAVAGNKSKTTFEHKLVTRNTVKITRPKVLHKSTTSKILPEISKNRSSVNLVANFRGTLLASKHQKENKLKNFIERNKQLFEEFLKKKKMEAQNVAAQKVVAQKLEKGKLRWKADDGEMSDDKTALRQGQVRLRTESMEQTTLNPEMLDMAPARGGQLHSYRVKGRLCQRHVLIPEGPKYNSRGEAYVPAYGHHRGRDYARTPHPKYVLPRCCNCCRKSLLGCE